MSGNKTGHNVVACRWYKPDLGAGLANLANKHIGNSVLLKSEIPLFFYYKYLYSSAW